MATLAAITIDCHDATRLALFWAAALDGYMTDETNHVLKPTGPGPTIYFQEVPEPRSAKNRVHIDIATKDAKGDIFRLERLGAKVLREVEERGNQWVVMNDPEGNEFCVIVA